MLKFWSWGQTLTRLMCLNVFNDTKISESFWKSTRRKKRIVLKVIYTVRNREIRWNISLYEHTLLFECNYTKGKCINLWNPIYSRENRYNIYLVSILLKRRFYQITLYIIMKALSTKVICHNKLRWTQR